jgi:murein DD-endopeptidase MepM/ murein hydrolase activator NlpD
MPQVQQKPKYYMPCLPWSEYSVQFGTRFLDPAYERAEGALHPGCDINRKTGGDSDLGKPVYAMTNGEVVAAKFYPVWGNIVVIYHPGPNVWTMSAHLQKMSVRKGAKVKAGQQIGTIGKGAPDRQHPRGRFWAHLHYEIRTVGLEEVPPQDWPSATMSRGDALEQIERTRVDPIAFLEKNNALKTLDD